MFPQLQGLGVYGSRIAALRASSGMTATSADNPLPASGEREKEAAAGLSIIIPVLNEAAGIVAALEALVPLRARGAEIIVADGGSQDQSVVFATPFADQIIT